MDKVITIIKRKAKQLLLIPVRAFYRNPWLWRGAYDAVVPLLVFMLSEVYRRRRLRGLAYDAMPPDTLVLADCGLEKFIVNTSDKEIGRHCYYFQKAFDVEKLETALNLLPQSQMKRTLVDIGANIGTICIHAVINDLVERCIAFEPEPNNFRLLLANLALNGVEDKVDAYNFALSDGSTSFLEFELSPDNFGDHRVKTAHFEGRQNEQMRNTIRVDAKNLDDCLTGCDLKSFFLWMDTQGFEGFVLAGAKRITSQNVPFVTEFWPYGMERTGGYELLVNSVIKSQYKTIIDLTNPNVKMECSVETFKRLKDSLGSEGNFADLLIF